MKARPPVIRRSVDVEDGAISVLERGAGPTMVLLHGITGNAHVWDPIAEDLAEWFRVIALDQRGHGRTGGGFASYADRDFAKDVRDVVLEIGGPAIVVGHSLGARNAIVAAAMFPRHIAGVVAIDFVPYIEEDVFDALEVRVAGGNREFRDADDVRRYLRGRYPHIREDAIERRLRFGYVPSAQGGLVPRADAEAMRLTARGLRADLSSYVRKCPRPVWFIRGGESRLVSKQAFETTRQLAPDQRYLTLDGIDHYIIETVPEAVVRIVLEFSRAVWGVGNATG